LTQKLEDAVERRQCDARHPEPLAGAEAGARSIPPLASAQCDQPTLPVRRAPALLEVSRARDDIHVHAPAPISDVVLQLLQCQITPPCERTCGRKGLLWLRPPIRTRVRRAASLRSSPRYTRIRSTHDASLVRSCGFGLRPRDQSRLGRAPGPFRGRSVISPNVWCRLGEAMCSVSHSFARPQISAIARDVAEGSLGLVEISATPRVRLQARVRSRQRDKTGWGWLAGVRASTRSRECPRCMGGAPAGSAA
jgi:hypothetical protein